jgi:hypothetical protein
MNLRAAHVGALLGLYRDCRALDSQLPPPWSTPVSDPGSVDATLWPGSSRRVRR